MTAGGGSIVEEGATVLGRFVSESLLILGKLEGEVEVTASVRIGPTALVRGNVRADSVRIEGRFDGDISCRRLAFTSTSSARGRFVAELISIEEGAIVEGAFNLAETPRAAIEDRQTTGQRADRPADAPGPVAPGTVVAPPDGAGAAGRQSQPETAGVAAG